MQNQCKIHFSFFASDFQCVWDVLWETQYSPDEIKQMSSVLRSQTLHFHQLVSDNSYIVAWCSSSTLAFDGLGHNNVYMCKDTATWFKPKQIIHTWVRTWQMEKNITANKIQSWLKLIPDVLVKTNRPQYSVLWLHLLIQINEVTTANMFVLSPGAFDCAVTSWVDVFSIWFS